MRLNNICRFAGKAMVCLIASFFTFSSCIEDNDETIALKENPRKHAYTSFVNERGQTTFVYNRSEGNDAYVITDKDGKIEKMNLVFTQGDETEYGTIFLYAKAIRSITIDDVTYTFHQNKSGKVDVAITSHGYTDLFTNVGDATSIGFDDETSVSQIFSSISCALGIIIATNDLVDPTSDVYPYISNIKDLLAYMDDSSSEFSDPDTSDELVERAEDGEDPGLNTSGVDGNEDEAEDNTDIGNGAIVSGIGELKVTLTWKFSADIDLHIYEPGCIGSIPSSSSNRGHIYFSNKNGSFTDGFLDIDNTIGYYINPVTGERNSRLSAVENVFWNENPSDGLFNVYLHYYGGTESGPCTITIYRRGKTVYSTTVNMTSNNKSTQRYICTVNMPQGTVSQTRSMDSLEGSFDYWLLPQK